MQLEERLQAYLKHQLPAAVDVRVANLQRIPGGASRETWSFDAAWREAGEEVQQGLILRRDPDASLLETERDVEFQVMDAVYGRVPVPRMHWIETSSEWLDRPFFIMSRIDGCETNPTRLLTDPRFFAVRAKIATQFASVLARVHAVDWRAAGLASLGVPESEAACGLTEIEKWEAVLDRDSLEPQPVLRAALRYLRHHQPPPAQRIVLVHADYRTGNFLCDPTGEIKGVLDWEMTHLGDPIEDVGWACMRPWRWLGNELIGGLMERAGFYRMYEAESGLKVDDDAVRLWELLGNVKFAAIFVTGARSFCEGRTRSPMMALLGRNIARIELEIMDLLGA
ncbi:MAG: phosphotransferase family protein [Chloroflexi bacterium]|nr:MAG: phosphotransferase family protein [Chloroflexota bacterium]